MKKYKISIALQVYNNPDKGGFFGVEVEAPNEKEAKKLAVDSLLYNKNLSQREVAGNAVAEEITTKSKCNK